MRLLVVSDEAWSVILYLSHLKHTLVTAYLIFITCLCLINKIYSSRTLTNVPDGIVHCTCPLRLELLGMTGTTCLVMLLVKLLQISKLTGVCSLPFNLLIIVWNMYLRVQDQQPSCKDKAINYTRDAWEDGRTWVSDAIKKCIMCSRLLSYEFLLRRNIILYKLYYV